MSILPRRRRIAVLELFGTIGGRVRPPVYERMLSSVRKSRGIGALVLDIDSPGGGVSASDYLYRIVARVAEEKPVVASIRGTGASGAYLISCAATRVVASPGALIGSIGVISVRPMLEELMRRVGIGVDVSKSGALKDMGAFWRASTPEEKQKIQALVDESYDTFVSVVAESRGMDEASARSLATGELFWAPKALENGLVDELGDLDRAIDLAAELSGAPRRVVHVRPPRTFRERLFGPLAESLVDSAANEMERRLHLGWMMYQTDATPLGLGPSQMAEEPSERG